MRRRTRGPPRLVRYSASAGTSSSPLTVGASPSNPTTDHPLSRHPATPQTNNHHRSSAGVGALGGYPTDDDAEYRRTLRPPGRFVVERMGQGVGGGVESA
ncbi:unnamed protein product [Macrosiphum euphorbiae]|uniref:Uncharacterized protein n=1 Tax=Macrosiphum euphorbiae TaxID=13131 RepID=A0AAV0XEV8_9HEMI|nr:unnamed protein product [Macrosiphum euphorbiae]